MPNINIIPKAEFVKMDLRGRFDYENTLSALHDMILELGNNNSDDFLFDLLGTDCSLSEMDIYQIAEFMEENVGLFHGRIALLLGASYIIDNSRFLKFCVNDPSIRIRIFFDRDSAQEWLASPYLKDEFTDN